MGFLSKIGRKIRKSLIRLLEDKPTKEKKKAKKNAPTVHQPGLICPQCDFKMPMSVELLLSGAPIECPSCELKLNIEKEDSKPVLDSLKKLDEVIKKAEDQSAAR